MGAILGPFERIAKITVEPSLQSHFFLLILIKRPTGEHQGEVSAPETSMRAGGWMLVLGTRRVHQSQVKFIVQIKPTFWGRYAGTALGTVMTIINKVITALSPY